MPDRKKEHIELAFKSHISTNEMDDRFYYEPMLNPHPPDTDQEFQFLGKSFRVPMWVSSMTGGTQDARKINENLARVCNAFGFGMGLGSCRSLLNDKRFFDDFNLRDIIGSNRAFFANLGISQVERLIEMDRVDEIKQLVSVLQADGLIIHVNPFQEWIQPEGDRINTAPVITIERLLEKIDFPLIIKEVGQGMGPESLRRLLHLPLAAIEFAAFGGTNFSKLELMRKENPEQRSAYEPLSKIGMDALSMVNIVNDMVLSEQDIRCRELIISGGIKSFVDGYYLTERSRLPAIYGQASIFLQYAHKGYDELYRYVESQVKGWRMAKAYLRIKE